MTCRLQVKGIPFIRDYKDQCESKLRTAKEDAKAADIALQRSMLAYEQANTRVRDVKKAITLADGILRTGLNRGWAAQSGSG